MVCCRCQGYLHWDFTEWFCINCGHRPPMAPIAPPIIDESRHVQNEFCNICLIRRSLRGKSLCIVHWAEEHGRSHSKMVADGQRKAKEARG